DEADAEVEGATHLLDGDPATGGDEPADGRYGRRADVDLRAKTLGEGAREVPAQAAARDVRARGDASGAEGGEAGARVDAGGSQQRVPEGLAKPFGLAVDGEGVVSLEEDLAGQRVAVRVEAARGEREETITRLHTGAVEDVFASDHAH